MPVGTILVAEKNMFMDYDGEQWLTKGEEYAIVENPLYYKYPIVIIDDVGKSHHCPLSSFSHIKTTNQ